MKKSRKRKGRKKKGLEVFGFAHVTLAQARKAGREAAKALKNI